VSNADDFIPGKKILSGLDWMATTNRVFKGIIIKHSIRIREDGNGELIIECRDEAIKMATGRHSRYYENLKDSQLMDELIGHYKPSLKGDVETTGTQTPRTRTASYQRLGLHAAACRSKQYVGNDNRRRNPDQETPIRLQSLR